MLQIWVGRAGSGKSAAVLQAMQENRAQRAQVLIVPEHTSHEAELELCRALGPTASRDAEVLSLQNLAGRVLAQTGGLADFTLDGGGKLLTMRLALQELSSQLRVFGNPSRRASFLQQLVELTDELYAYDVSPAELLRQVEEAPDGGDKLRDVALLYGAYDAKLRAGGRDARSRVQKLADELEHATYLTDKDVYFDGFSYFNKVEERILRTTLRQAHSVTVTLLGDKRPGQLFLNRTTGRHWVIWSVTSLPALSRGRRKRNRSDSMKPPRPFTRWNMRQVRFAAWWPRAGSAIGTLLLRRGTWRPMPRCWKMSSAGRKSRYTSAGAAIFCRSRRCCWCWVRWMLLQGALNMRTCSAI